MSTNKLPKIPLTSVSVEKLNIEKKKLIKQLKTIEESPVETRSTKSSVRNIQDKVLSIQKRLDSVDTILKSRSKMFHSPPLPDDTQDKLNPQSGVNLLPQPLRNVVSLHAEKQNTSPKLSSPLVDLDQPNQTSKTPIQYKSLEFPKPLENNSNSIEKFDEMSGAHGIDRDRVSQDDKQKLIQQTYEELMRKMRQEHDQEIKTLRAQTDLYRNSAQPISSDSNTKYTGTIPKTTFLSQATNNKSITRNDELNSFSPDSFIDLRQNSPPPTLRQIRREMEEIEKDLCYNQMNATNNSNTKHFDGKRLNFSSSPLHMSEANKNIHTNQTNPNNLNQMPFMPPNQMPPNQLQSNQLSLNQLPLGQMPHQPYPNFHPQMNQGFSFQNPYMNQFMPYMPNFSGFPPQYNNNQEYVANNLSRQINISESNNAVRPENNQFRRNFPQPRNLSPSRTNNNEYNPNNNNNSRHFIGETNDRLSQYRDNSCRASFIRYIKKIPTFSGQSHGELLNFIEICDTINALCTNNSEYEEFITNIIFQLRGEARSALPDSQEWIDIRAKLMSSFKYLSNRTILDSQIENLRQEKDESLTKYGERARKLLSEKNRSFNFISEEQKLEHDRIARKSFSRGFGDQKLKDVMVTQNFSSLEDAISRSMEIESEISNSFHRREFCCSFCKKMGHRESECRSKTNNSTPIGQLVSALKGLNTQNSNNPKNSNTFGNNSNSSRNNNNNNNNQGFRSNNSNRTYNQNYSNNGYNNNNNYRSNQNQPPNDRNYNSNYNNNNTNTNNSNRFNNNNQRATGNNSNGNNANGFNNNNNQGNFNSRNVRTLNHSEDVDNDEMFFDSNETSEN